VTVTVVVVVVKPLHKHALEYLTAPEQALAYAGTVLVSRFARTVLFLRPVNVSVT
jgi:hypothetical protein